MASSAQVFPAATLRASANGVVRVDCVVGHAAVLERLSVLEPIVRGTLQQFELQDVAYFLNRPQRPRNTPHLLLIYGGPRQGLMGGVLLQQFHQIYLSLDSKGRRCVFAEGDCRLDLAAIAARYFLDRGARLVHIDLDLGLPYTSFASRRAEHEQAQAIAAFRINRVRSGEVRWSLGADSVYTHMPLQPDFDATLAPLGRKARKNLRRYRRLAMRELNLSFEPNAHLSERDLRELSDDSHFPVSRREVLWRHHSFQQYSNTFCCGLQAPSGEWLAVAGYRRNGLGVEIDWQMNRRGYETYSLVTALRSAFIQHECSLGTTRFATDTGELHQMSESFPRTTIYNLTAHRPNSWLIRLLALVLPRIRPLHVMTAALRRTLTRDRTSYARL